MDLEKMIPSLTLIQGKGKRREPKPPHILVCEDDGATLLQLKATLQHLGCRVTTAAVGSAAFHELQTQTFDLVIMDYNMPLRLTGKCISELLPWEAISTPMILTSAEDHTRDAGEQGFLAFYPKPLTVDVMQEILKRYVVGKIVHREPAGSELALAAGY